MDSLQTRMGPDCPIIIPPNLWGTNAIPQKSVMLAVIAAAAAAAATIRYSTAILKIL
jgi:hypothetical protein